MALSDDQTTGGAGGAGGTLKDEFDDEFEEEEEELLGEWSENKDGEEEPVSESGLDDFYQKDDE